MIGAGAGAGALTLFQDSQNLAFGFLSTGVPEPVSIALAGLALVGGYAARRRRQA